MSGLAIVLGGAATLRPDLEETGRLVGDPQRHTVIAVNDAGYEWPGRLDHWVTGHPDELGLRVRRREERGYVAGYQTWTRVFPFGAKHLERLCDHVLDGWWGGSSGLLAVGVARELGLRVILCGVPMDGGPHFNRDGQPWGAHLKYRDLWRTRMGVLGPYVRSWSGWTREMFGAPDAAWVDGRDAA